MFRVDCAVIGAGVIGLAIARKLAKRGHEVLVLEAEAAIGTGISSRNSEVIHAGLYYATASRKAELCLEGRKLLYSYAELHGIPCKRYGKLIVATEDKEIDVLQHIEKQAKTNGVDDLHWLTASDVRMSEPALRAEAALLSPSTGVIDSHGLMLALQGDLNDCGGDIAFCAPVLCGTAREDGQIELRIGGAETATIVCRSVINAAGLAASRVALAIDGVREQAVPQTFYAKGCYFRLSGRTPFHRLIYPVPVPGGLGTHLTLDLNGQARFGPDVEWVDVLNYDINSARVDEFYCSVRRYWPGLAAQSLTPDYAGIRPKIVGPGEPAGDFSISGPEENGVCGLINLFGIESPGLTSSLAIARNVANMVNIMQIR